MSDTNNETPTTYSTPEQPKGLLARFWAWVTGEQATREYNARIEALINPPLAPEVVAEMSKQIDDAAAELGVVLAQKEYGPPYGPDHISEHFSWKESACNDKDGTLPPKELHENVRAAAAMMEEIRAFFGNRRITVNSWYRTQPYNKQVGGAKNSMHLQGKAVDFTVEGMTPKQVFAKLVAARDAAKLKIGGIGGYAGFVHCDTGKKRTWQG